MDREVMRNLESCFDNGQHSTQYVVRANVSSKENGNRQTKSKANIRQ